MLVRSYGFWGHKTLRLIAADCSRLLGGLRGLGVRDRSETCVWDYRQVAWGLMGSGGKWSKFASNAVEQKGSFACLSRFL